MSKTTQHTDGSTDTPRDFTFEIYGDLIDAGLEAGYEFITVREYLSNDELPDRFVIMRHDIDRKVENSLAMAELEAEKGIPATHYYRAIDKTNVPEIHRQVEELGHEVGYHYEDMDKAKGDVDAAHERFAENLAAFREHVSIDTICMHGNPLTKYDNRDMWEGDRSFDEYDLLGEAYLSMDFTDVTYFTDSSRTWEDNKLNMDDSPVGPSSKDVQAETTHDLIEILENHRVDRLCLLSHPNRWAQNTSEYYIESTKDIAINTVKWVMATVR